MIRHKRPVLVRTVRRCHADQYRTGFGRQRRRARRMIRMRVRSENPLDRTGRFGDDFLEMLIDTRARIDDRNLCIANQVRIRTRPGHHAGICCCQPAHRWRQLFAFTGTNSGNHRSKSSG